MHLFNCFSFILHLFALVYSYNDCSLGPCFPSPREIASKLKVIANSTCGQGNIAEEYYYSKTALGFDTCNASHPNQTHPTAYINDAFALDTFWKSRNTDKPVFLQFDFGVQLIVYRSVVTFQFELPTAMYFSKSKDNGSTFEALAFYATKCGEFFNMTETQSNRKNGLAVECFMIDQTNNPEKQIEYGPMRDRVTSQAVIDSHQNQTYFVMTNFRLVLVSYIDLPGYDPATASDELKKSLYFSVRDWEVTGACFCNGQASLCDSQNIGKCICERNTSGNNCERCSPLYNNSPYKIRQPCEACECHGHADGCHYNSTKGYGVCDSCSNNTMGDKCESCKIGNVYRPQADQSYPCLECACDVKGSNGSSCHPISGQCACKPNFLGRQCDRCIPNYFNNGSGSGCFPCDCNSNFSTSLQCNDMGVCPCKPGIGGTKCTVCKSNFCNPTSSVPTESTSAFPTEPIAPTSMNW